MKPICKNCQYQRQPGEMDFNIPGTGTWCSNGGTTRYRTRVEDNDGCNGFAARGKKAPLGMRLKVKGLEWMNKLMRKK